MNQFCCYFDYNLLNIHSIFINKVYTYRGEWFCKENGAICVDLCGLNSSNNCIVDISHCVSEFGSYQCICDEIGYQYIDDECVDIDECQSNDTNNCTLINNYCNNTIGSYQCIEDISSFVSNSTSRTSIIIETDNPYIVSSEIITSSFISTSSSTISFMIGGLNSNSKIIVNGNATFDGTLQIELINGFIPDDGAQIELFNYRYQS